MRVGSAVRFHLTALLAGFIGGAVGWMLLDSTVSAQSDVVEASRVVVGNTIVIENGQITFQSGRKNDSYTALNMQGLFVRNGAGKGAQAASVRAGEVSVTTRYEEAGEIFKRVDLEAGSIQYYPDFRDVKHSQEVEDLDMDVLFKRQRAELNARQNRRGRI